MIRIAFRYVRNVSSVTAVGFVLIMGVLPLVVENRFLLRILTFALLYGLFVMSWDVLSGTTEELNFGHAFWILAGGYTAAWSSLHLGYGPWVGVPLGALASGSLGCIIGVLTLRVKGPYFAMVTLALGGILYKLSFIYSGVLGAEEGISGVTFLSRSIVGDFYVVMAVVFAAYLVLYRVYRSDFALVLKGIKANDDVVRASGINPSLYKVVAFSLSGSLAGVGGALYAHAQGQIGSAMAAGALSALIVLYAMIATRGTLHGPLVAGILFYLLNQWLRFIEEWRLLLFAGALMVAIYVFPEGVVRAVRVKLSDARRTGHKAEGAGIEGIVPSNAPAGGGSDHE